MAHRLLRLLAVLTGIFIACIGTIVAQPAHNRTAEFFDAADCTMPCWHGIQPGTTGVEVALAILEADPWIEPVRTTEIRSQPTFFSWRWSEAYPFTPSIVDPNIESDDGRIGFAIHPSLDQLVVGSINLNAGLPLADVWLALGPPKSFSVGRLVDQSGGILLYLTLSNLGFEGLSATVYQPCPLDREMMWASAISVQMSPEPVDAERLLLDESETLVRLLQQYNRLFC